jgi:hypothetical protein
MKTIIAAFSLLLLASTSQAAEITHNITDKGNRYISIDGEIAAGDFEKFVSIVRANPDTKALVLDSNGGAVGEGMSIATMTKLQGMTTFVLNKHICFSICAPIFFSGNKKFVERGAILGVHSAHDGNGLRADKTNALITWYFGSLGYDIGLAEMWIDAEPDKMNFITFEINKKLNLGIVSLD